MRIRFGRVLYERPLYLITWAGKYVPRHVLITSEYTDGADWALPCVMSAGDCRVRPVHVIEKVCSCAWGVFTFALRDY